MSTLLLANNETLELEGTAEEIQARLAEYAGQRLHVVVQPAQADAPPAEPTSHTPGVQNVAEQLPTMTEKIDTAPALSLSEQFARLRAENPEEWNALPSDLAEQHDHYIYGWPKK